MSIPAGAEVVDLADLLVVLREHGVTEFVSGDLRLSLSQSVPSTAIAVTPSTPEQPGKSDTYVPPPSKDIFDVLSDGVIPGAPTRDGLPVDPSTG